MISKFEVKKKIKFPENIIPVPIHCPHKYKIKATFKTVGLCPAGLFNDNVQNTHLKKKNNNNNSNGHNYNDIILIVSAEDRIKKSKRDIRIQEILLIRGELWFPFMILPGSDASTAGLTCTTCTLIVDRCTWPCSGAGAYQPRCRRHSQHVVIDGYVQYDRWGRGRGWQWGRGARERQDR